jgi:hypothetical protein
VNKPDDQVDLLAGHLSDADTAWSIGTFGAIAEFTRDADEAVALERIDGAIAAVTARGGLRLVAHEAMRLVASESLTTQSWSHRVSLCLPAGLCAMDGHTVLTEIGPDADALRAEDRAAVLFDLGLGTLQLNACIRTGDAEVIASLQKWTGRSLFELGSGAMAVILAANPHRVFVSHLGRVEVFQPIPPPNGKSPKVRIPMSCQGSCATSAPTPRRNLFRQALCHAPTSIRPIRREMQWGSACPSVSIATRLFNICSPASATRNS